MLRRFSATFTYALVVVTVAFIFATFILGVIYTIEKPAGDQKAFVGMLFGAYIHAWWAWTAACGIFAAVMTKVKGPLPKGAVIAYLREAF